MMKDNLEDLCKEDIRFLYTLCVSILSVVTTGSSYLNLTHNDCIVLSLISVHQPRYPKWPF